MRLANLAVVSLCAVLVWLVVWSERPSTRAGRALLPMNFAHADHGEINCVQCHHNFTDEVGFGTDCLLCHQIDASVAHLVEQQFHDLCRGCHQQRQRDGEPGGPVRACRECHTGDDLP